MDILQHDPMSFFVTNLQFGMGNWLNTLSQRNWMKSLCWVHSAWFSKVLYVQYWVSTWWKDEVDESCWCGVVVGRCQNLEETGCWIAVHEVITVWKCLSAVVIKCDSLSIGSEYSDNEELLELLLFQHFPVEWQFDVFWLQLIIPILESGWCTSYDVASKVLESFDFNEFLHALPGTVWEPFFQWV